MADKLVIGVELLDYASDLLEITNKLAKAKKDAEEVAKEWGDDTIYAGDALVEMRTFANQLVLHLDKLILLYQKGAVYISNTYESMYQSDEAMAIWMLSKMAEEGGL